MIRTHDGQCRCADCRHGRFNPGPASNPRRLNFYGSFHRGRAWKRLRSEQHALAGHPGAHDGWCSFCKVSA